MHKNIARRELDEGVKMLMTNNSSNGMSSSSLQDLNVSSGSGSNETSPLSNGGAQVYENTVPYRHHNQHRHNHTNEYRKSMPNLQEFNHAGATSWGSQGIRLTDYQPNHYNNDDSMSKNYQFGDLSTTSRSEMHLPATPETHSYSTSTSHISHSHRGNNNSDQQNNIYGNMTRDALMQISAVPKPKLTNDWIQYRKSEPVKPSLNSHWLIQEAEQRRIDQMNNARSSSSNAKKKPLPDAIIQTIQQRIVDLGIGSNVNKR